MENTRELFQIMTRRFGLLNKNCCTAGGIDISLIQSHILYEIEHMHQPSIQQVADVLGTDRRVHVLSLTTEGKFVAATIDHQMNAYLEEVFSHMNEFEKETVIRSIKLLNASMAKSSVCCTPLG
jgi:hypothetical protein